MDTICNFSIGGIHPELLLVNWPGGLTLQLNGQSEQNLALGIFAQSLTNQFLSFSFLPTYLPTYVHVPTYLPTYIHVPTYIYVLTYLPTYMYLPTPGGGGTPKYKGLMGTCGQPGYVFRDFCLKRGIEFIIYCLNQGIGLSIFVLNRISFLGRSTAKFLQALVN